MIVTHKINMNMDRAGVMPRVDVVQGDANTREIQFSLFSGGQAWEVPADAQVLVRYKKANGAGGTYDTMSDGAAAAVVSGNTVTVTLAPQALSADGSVSLAVTLAKGDAELSTFAVQLNVMKNPTAVTDDDGNYVSVAGMIPVATGASVGQYVAVAATDPSGTVTKLKAATPIAGGQPIPISSSADMTDPEKIYLYSGSESGFKKGHWYYNANGSWVDGGLYGESDVTSDDVPVNADIDDTNMVSFRNAAGITLFTLDLAGLSSGDVYFGKVVISAERLEVAEGGTGTFTVCLETAPSVNQPVYLAVSDATRLSISPSTLTFTPDNYATEQTVTVTALQDEDEDDDSVTVTLTSRKVDPKQVVVAITDNDIYVPFGGKEIVSLIHMSSVEVVDNAATYYDEANDETISQPGYGSYFWPFKTGVTGVNLQGTPTKARELLDANTTGAYSLIEIWDGIAVPNASAHSNGLMGLNEGAIYNAFLNNSWNSIGVKLKGMGYRNIAGELATLTLGETVSSVTTLELPTETDGWTKGVTATVFTATGEVVFYAGNVEVYRIAAPDDFVSWDWNISGRGWAELLYRPSEPRQTAIIVNDAVTADDIEQYYDRVLTDATF